MGIYFHFPGPSGPVQLCTRSRAALSDVAEPPWGTSRNVPWEHSEGKLGRVTAAQLASLVQPCRSALQSTGITAWAPAQRAVQGLCMHGAGGMA